VKCEVQRRQAKRLADLYWNPLLTALEPLACSACGESGYRFGFTDDRVAPRCPACL
jgi:predicted Zn-ribbon and HTH transcriptional regulator